MRLKKKTIPFTVASERIKYLRIDLTKKVQLVHWTLQNIIERIKPDLNQWKDIPCSSFTKLSIVTSQIDTHVPAVPVANLGRNWQADS